MKVLRIVNMETAIRVYYSNLQLSCKEIKELYGQISNASVCKLKKLAREEMVKSGAPIWDNQTVDRVCAYRAWHIDIDNLVDNYNKCRELGIISN